MNPVVIRRQRQKHRRHPHVLTAWTHAAAPALISVRQSADAGSTAASPLFL